MVVEERSAFWTGQLHFERKDKDRRSCDLMILRVAMALSKAPWGAPCDDRNDAGSSNTSQIRSTSISWPMIFPRGN